MESFGRSSSSASATADKSPSRRFSKVDAGKFRDDVVEMATKAASSVTDAINARRHSKIGAGERATDPSKVHEDLDFLKLKRKSRQEGRKEEIKKFHESLRNIEGLRYHRQGPIAALAVVSVLIGVVVNELCVSHDYVPELTDEILGSIKAANGRQCDDKAGDPLKILVTILTIALMCLTFKQWQLKTEAVIQRQQLEDWMYLPGGGVARTAVPLSTHLKLVCELFICAIHPLPYVRGDWEFQVDSETTVFYRFESVTVAIMVLRLYHLWRWFYLMATWKFTNLEDSFVVMDYSTIERLSESNSSIARTTFPLKVMMAIHPVRVIVCVVGTLFLAVTYLVRISEGPAGQRHSGDWWDQLWVTITQGTTGYGGSPPWTQWGRLCAVLMMCLGPMTVSVMTAATTKSITLSVEEALVFRSMQRNTLRVAVLTAAVRILQFWWRHKQAMRRLGITMPKRSTNIAVAFLSALAPNRSTSITMRARTSFEQTPRSTDAARFQGLGTSQLGMIREGSSKSIEMSRQASRRSQAPSAITSPTARAGGIFGANGLHSPTARDGTGAAGNGAATNGAGLASPSQTPKHQRMASEVGSLNSGASVSNVSGNMSGSGEQPRTRGRRPSISVSLGLSGGSGEGEGASMIGRGMRSRIGQFASLKHIIPFWEDDSANKKVQLLRNFYMALEEYDRFLANNKAVGGEHKEKPLGGPFSPDARSRSSSMDRGPAAVALNTPVNWTPASSRSNMTVRGSRRRQSETGLLGAEFARLEAAANSGAGVQEMERWRSERKMRLDIEHVQREVQDLREGMGTMMAILHRIEAAVCPPPHHRAPAMPDRQPAPHLNSSTPTTAGSSKRDLRSAGGSNHDLGSLQEMAAAGVGFGDSRRGGLGGLGGYGGGGDGGGAGGAGGKGGGEGERTVAVPLSLSPMHAEVHLGNMRLDGLGDAKSQESKCQDAKGQDAKGQDAKSQHAKGRDGSKHILRPPSLVGAGLGGSAGNVSAEYVSGENGRAAAAGLTDQILGGRDPTKSSDGAGWGVMRSLGRMETYVAGGQGRMESFVRATADAHQIQESHIVPEQWEEKLLISPSAKATRRVSVSLEPEHASVEAPSRRTDSSRPSPFSSIVTPVPVSKSPSSGLQVSLQGPRAFAGSSGGR